MAFLAAIKKRSDLRAQGVAKEADDRDPTTVYDDPWIGELEPKRFAEQPSGGKWMLFYDRNKLWMQWKKCQQLYRSNKLRGVSSLKVSTSHPHHASHVGVIILYCGPPDDQQRVKQIGKTILKETKYTNTSRKMFYKTDTQTLSNGKAGYHKFELLIPQSNFDDLKIKPINNKPLHTQYSRTFLQTLSKSQVIDIALRLQQFNQNTSNKPLSAAIPAPLPKPKAPMAPMAPMAPVPAPIPKPKAPMAPMAPILSNTAVAPMAPVMNAAVIATNANIIAPPAPLIKKKKYTKYDQYVTKIKLLGFERTVIIDRSSFEMLSCSNKRRDSKKEWKQRIEQQSVLNGRQKLVVLSWFRKEILNKENRFKFQRNWDFPGYILNIITLHYLENIDDKQQLIDDWSDNYKPCFYFYQEKWNILLREGENRTKYQSLVCLKGKECLIAKQCKSMWIITKVRVMAKTQMKHRYQWMSYQFSSAPQAYNAVSAIFDEIEEEEEDTL